MDAAGKRLAEKAIDSVKERGHTNLSGGLLAALEALYRIPSTDASLVESVLLFTDGKANVGIKDSAALVKATKYVGHMTLSGGLEPSLVTVVCILDSQWLM